MFYFTLELYHWIKKIPCLGFCFPTKMTTHSTKLSLPVHKHFTGPKFSMDHTLLWRAIGPFNTMPCLPYFYNKLLSSIPILHSMYSNPNSLADFPKKISPSLSTPIGMTCTNTDPPGGETVSVLVQHHVPQPWHGLSALMRMIHAKECWVLARIQ